MRLNIKYFGLVADITNTHEEDWMFKNNYTVANFISDLKEKYNPISGVPFKVSVNHAFATDDILLSENDLIAILPPFAGG